MKTIDINVGNCNFHDVPTESFTQYHYVAADICAL